MSKDLDIKCMCGNPECKQELNIRIGAVYLNGSNAPAHWKQGYISIYGLMDNQLPEVMLDPEHMRVLRDWLNEVVK